MHFCCFLPVSVFLYLCVFGFLSVCVCVFVNACLSIFPWASVSACFCECGLKRPKSSEIAPEVLVFTRHQSSPPWNWPSSPDTGRNRSIIGRVRPKLVNVAQELAVFARNRQKSLRKCSFSPEFCRDCPKIGQRCSELADPQRSTGLESKVDR